MSSALEKKAAKLRAKKEAEIRAKLEEEQAAMLKDLANDAHYSAILRQLFKKSFYEFFVYFWKTIIPDDYVDNWHVKVICDELQEIGFRVIERQNKTHDLLVNLPPGESKSTIISVAFPAWLWSIDPTIKIITASINAPLALRMAQQSRSMIESQPYRWLYPTVRLRKDAKAKSFYENEHGGFRLSTSVRADIIGNHAHIHIIDDPNTNDPLKLESKEQLKQINDWRKQKLGTRKTNKKLTPTILVQQRLAINDCSGDMLKNAGNRNTDRVRHLSIPAEAKYNVVPESLRVHYKDGLMNPKRSGREELETEKKRLGSRGYDAQFGMSPTAVEGNIIKKKHIKRIAEHQVPMAVWNKIPDFVVDTAYKEGEENDPSAILRYVEHNGYVYILSFKYAKMEFGGLIKFLYDETILTGKHASRIYIEPKASGLSVIQTMKSRKLMQAWGFNQRLNIIEYKMPFGDKTQRLNSVAPYFEAGNVFVLEGPDMDEYVNELLAYPTGTIREAADLTSMALTNAFTRKIAQGYSMNR